MKMKMEESPGTINPTILDNLSDFTNFVFNPHQSKAFSFSDIHLLLQSCKLQFVGWRLNDLIPEEILKYKVFTLFTYSILFYSPSILFTFYSMLF